MVNPTIFISSLASVLICSPPLLFQPGNLPHFIKSTSQQARVSKKKSGHLYSLAGIEKTKQLRLNYQILRRFTLFRQMAAKISTIVLKVDLDCKSCYKKISKTISQLQERENIETVVYDEKNNTVTISGPFDAKRLCKKLCCKACKVIKDIQIKEPKKEEPKKEVPKKEEPKKEEPKKEVPKKEEPKKEEPKKEEPKKDPPPVVKAPEPECQPCWPGPVCVCGCKPWYGGYYGNNRCPWCGRGFDYEWVAPPQVVVQPPVVVYGAPPDYYGHKTCEFFYEEEPQAGCAIM